MSKRRNNYKQTNSGQMTNSMIKNNQMNNLENYPNKRENKKDDLKKGIIETSLVDNRGNKNKKEVQE